MVKLLAREAGLVVLSALLTTFLVPALQGNPPAPGLFWVGFLMAMAFMAIYAMAILGGNRMPERVRDWLGIFSWVGLVANDLVILSSGIRAGEALTVGSIYSITAPALFGLLLAAYAGGRAPAESRRKEMLVALYRYSFSVAIVRWFLAPMMGGSQQAMTAAIQVGVLYMAIRTLTGLIWPSGVEGNEHAPALIHRPVPDHVVGMVERISRQMARPYATCADGTEDQDAVSVLVRPSKAEAVACQIAQELQEQPFEVLQGPMEKGRTQIVVRPRR